MVTADRIDRAAAAIRARSAVRPIVGIILGSGLGGFVDRVRVETTIGYADIPGFHAPSAIGHSGRFTLGWLGDTPVAVLAGRIHLYEGHAPEDVAFPVWVLAALGVTTLIVTNASGGVAGDLEPGDIVVLNDHLSFPSLAGRSPLVAQQVGERFVSLDAAYDPGLVEEALAALREAGFRNPRSGVYAMVGGPSYETPAEIRLLRLLGVDVVGMSTVPEVIVARQQGLHVLALSLVTNAHGDESVVDPAEVVAVARQAGNRLGDAIVAIVGGLKVAS